ncbi:UGMP family protein [archaeon]|nr:UGMP family protein [archaeon]
MITSKGKILANVKESYITEKGGIIPIEAAKHHEMVKYDVLEKALEEAKLKLEDIDLVSFSNSPGLAPCLKVGMEFGKEISKKLKCKLIPVNHCLAHLSIGELVTGAKDPVFLYASGANTQIIAYEGGRYRVFGETLDMGTGNFIDNFARYLGLGFPGGPKISDLSKKGKYIELPYVVKGMDISVSGILTNLKQKYDKGVKKEDLCYSLQETVFAMLMEVSERAMAHCDKKELLYGGGVCCNDRLQEMGEIMCKERKGKCFIPERSLLVDNGLMIAWQGYLERESNKKIDFDPRLRTDDIDVTWK